MKVPSLTEKDEEDLAFAIAHDVDTVAVSFVRTADDVRHVKRRLAALQSDAWVIAKLEKPQAIEHLDSILEVADAIMVARGDLGVEVPPEKVPAIQKHIIKRAAEFRKPVITATQMLESMIENPRPTRAEASDVANAIYDGTDAVMLSGETAAGKYPVEAVAMMAKIVSETERQIRLDPPKAERVRGKAEALGRRNHLRMHGALGGRPRPRRDRHFHGERQHRQAALKIPAGAADLRAEPRPAGDQSHDAALGGRTRSCASVFLDTDKLVEMAETILEQRGLVQQRQVVGIVAGTRTRTGATNFMRLHMVGDRNLES